jgi:hypothetical protein
MKKRTLGITSRQHPDIGFQASAGWLDLIASHEWWESPAQ